MYRRQFLASSAAAAGTLAMPGFFTQGVQASQSRRLVADTRTLDIDGRAATVYSLTSGDKPGLAFRPGESFSVSLENRLREETIVHWHGLTPPVEQDGVAHAGGMLAAGEVRRYDFEIERPGTYWMHAHTLQEQNLLAAPLIVRSTEDERADMQEAVMLLHDFSFTPAEDLLARLTGGKGHDMSGMNHGEMDHGTHEGMTDAAMRMDLNDIEYDAYLANDRTLNDPDVVWVERSGRVRLRIINGAASTGFSIDTGTLDAELIAVDGQPVEPLRGRIFPMTMGQRLDLVIAIPSGGGAFPILALREGTPHRTGIVLATQGAVVSRLAATGDARGPVLDLALESRLLSRSPLAVRDPDKRFMVHLSGDMASYRWGMSGADGIAAEPGERVEIALMNMSMMAHPMHLHGHHFQIVDIDGMALRGALRDTVLVPPMKTVTIAFDAGKPGDWAFHCHHLYHMVSGMMAHVTVT